jgi:hypothetical protein
VGKRGTLTLDVTELLVISPATNSAVLKLSPLNLGAYSVTTLIARDMPAATPAVESPGVDVIALPTRLVAGNADLADVRLLQAGALDSDDTAAGMSLVPAGSGPGSTEVSLGIVSAATFGSSDAYQSVSPGSYQLTDTLGRFSPISMRFNAAETYTLIITNSAETVIVLQDSDQ